MLSVHVISSFQHNTVTFSNTGHYVPYIMHLSLIDHSRSSNLFVKTGRQIKVLPAQVKSVCGETLDISDDAMMLQQNSWHLHNTYTYSYIHHTSLPYCKVTVTNSKQQGRKTSADVTGNWKELYIIFIYILPALNASESFVCRSSPLNSLTET